MKTVQAHEMEAVVEADQSLRLMHVPFDAGERVRVVITEQRPGLSYGHTPAEVTESRSIRRQLRGTVLRYERPTDPVGVEDWELLR